MAQPSMEDQLLVILSDTLSSSSGPRKLAEVQLKQAEVQTAFPGSLATIGCHANIAIEVRQAALLSLRTFVDKNWSGYDENGPTITIEEGVKEQLRHSMLELATSNADRKLTKAASHVVSKIANVDFPEHWPNLLPTILQVISTADDTQTHGALKVLSDLVEESLSEDQFFAVARDITSVVYAVAVNENRKFSLRALAVSVFRSTFDIMDMVKDEHGQEVTGFADEVIKAWSPFFMETMQKRLPAKPKSEDEGYESSTADRANTWKGLITLKLQVVKTLAKVRTVFRQILLPQSPALFTATWEELSSLQQTYQEMFIENDEQGKLEDADAPPVREELERQIQSNSSVAATPWVMDIMKLAGGFAQIGKEEEDLWDIDVNLYLAEESTVTANYTPRTACGDLLIKLGEWLNQGALEDVSLGLLDRTIKGVNGDESEVVKVACIRGLQGFMKARTVPPGHQVPIVAAISDYLYGKDLTEFDDANDLLVTLVESLRDAISLDPFIAISSESTPLDLLFVLAKHGAADFQLTMLVTEAFEEIAEALAPSNEAYNALCDKVIPSLTSAFDIGGMTGDDPLVELAAELLAILTQKGSEPLPPKYVARALPKLNRLLMLTTEGAVLRPGVEAIKYMLMHDHQQVFEWHDEENRSGLEVSLIIIDKLLGPNIEDNAASEVGGLAAELVEKAGQERLGPYLESLLRAVASRLATAEAAPFIQSLILVFARLSLVGAQDVVEFLSRIDINGQNGLQVVLSKWTEHSVNFAGYDEIRQNVIALSKVYSLNDPRVAQTMVKGDLIIPTSNRIMTRSQAKLNPDQYTIIPAPLKIIKVLIEELLSASGHQTAAQIASQAAEFADEDNDNDDWEDVPSNILDLGLGTTKADLMAYANEGTASFMRQKDDETQAYLVEFFLNATRENVAGFNEVYALLTDEEKGKLNECAGGAGQTQ
ncbi:putative Importin subunit beta-5 [Glarea lozoyensis 74030]|uniref:Putative Importin subunit beta-5 n=1 Tax=Glarea lozoyensis (strain ATCC 74030 / MF5533) TaxID=1104152 RepID=H0EMN4_GLAL7|nr:putative Importin subunit beta-5 [Glarea lozoyensis 74030]